MKNHDIRPYEEIPEETREYSDFIVKISLLGDELGPVSCLEDRRIALHKAMAARYGLEYESTRGAVAMLEIGFRDVTNEKHVAMVLDQRMRNLKESFPDPLDVGKVAEEGVKGGLNMTSEYETVEDLVKELRGIKGDQHTNGGSSFERWRARCQFADDYAGRFEAAHQREVAELRECLIRRSSHLNAILQKALELRNDVPSELRKVMDECIVAEDKAIGLGMFSKKGAEDETK